MKLSRRTILAAAVAMGVLGTFGFAVAEQAAPAAGAVNVTVKYAGKGTVDASHRIWVWLFDTPVIDAGSMPIGEMSIDKNGGVATFSNLTANPVYVAVAYDEKGGFAGQSAPPPGSPVGFYGVKSATDQPMPVVPGPKGAVTITFTDAQRMQ